MSLDDMDHIWHNTASFSWPFHDSDVGDYFCERYDRLKSEQSGHLADPN